MMRFIAAILPLIIAHDTLAATTMSELSFTLNNLWILIAAGMVFIMHLGFALLESGLTSAKNAINILFKNLMIISMGLLTYAVVGFDLMYPGDEFAGQFFGFAGFGVSASPEDLTSAYNPHYTYWSDFLFQAMFAATAASIVSGAVAERIRLSVFMIYATLLVGFLYPVIGMWKWGGGFLDAMAVPFYDFAGSTIVHSVGGWAALVAATLIGPRRGRFSKGRIHYRPPHNYALVTTGVFLLWFGWFGFNGGSVLSAEPATLSTVFATTALSAAAGVMGAMLSARIIHNKTCLATSLNGALAGLVGITAGADVMSVFDAVTIGFISGLLVVISMSFFDHLRVDDPVSAISVHLVCGIWGTLAVGIFGKLASFEQLLSQLIGIACVGTTVTLFSCVVLFITYKIRGSLRVPAKVEVLGLDASEHQDSSYQFDIKLFR